MYGWPERVDNITRHDLMLQVTEHGNWLSGSLEAKKLYLGYKNLSVLSTLGGLNLTNTDFVESNCEGLVFSNCNLSHCNFIGANLANASFIDCDLSYSTFLDANLSGADLSGCNLGFSNFRKADLTGVNLTNTNIYYCIGNGKEIKNFYISQFLTTYTSTYVGMGCIYEPIEWLRECTIEDLILKYPEEDVEHMFDQIKAGADLIDLAPCIPTIYV